MGASRNYMGWRDSWELGLNGFVEFITLRIYGCLIFADYFLMVFGGAIRVLPCLLDFAVCLTSSAEHHMLFLLIIVIKLFKL